MKVTSSKSASALESFSLSGLCSEHEGSYQPPAASRGKKPDFHVLSQIRLPKEQFLSRLPSTS